jgi:hypothetical protein
MGAMVFRAVCLFFFAGVSGSCALVDQYGSRAFDGNLNTQSAINQEVLLNIIRASRYQSVSWNPASQINGSQTETLSTGLPTINIGPAQTAAQQISSITNSVSSGVSGGFTTAPLATTAFQAGMLTPVDLKIISSLTTYYPREAVFYALIGAIDVKLVSSNRLFAKLANDPNSAYYDIDYPFDLDQTKCYGLFKHLGPQVFFGPNRRYPAACYYAKFRNLLGLLIANGLYTELVQIPAQQPTQAQANQSNIVTVGRFCFNKNVVPEEYLVESSNFPACGKDNKQPAGGTVQTTTTETHKFDDALLPTSKTKTITTITNSVLPVTGRTFKVKFKGVGPVEITFEMRSPNGFLSYLGSWYNVGDKVPFASDNVPFRGYGSPPAQQIFRNGPYLSILNGASGWCYAWANYNGQIYCVPMEATHTSMLMDIAVILRNLNISPTDLNAPISVRVTP